MVEHMYMCLSVSHQRCHSDTSAAKLPIRTCIFGLERALVTHAWCSACGAAPRYSRVWYRIVSELPLLSPQYVTVRAQVPDAVVSLPYERACRQPSAACGCQPTSSSLPPPHMTEPQHQPFKAHGWRRLAMGKAFSSSVIFVPCVQEAALQPRQVQLSRSTASPGDSASRTTKGQRSH